MKRDPSPLDQIRSTLRPRLSELSKRRPGIYWTDFLISTALSWFAVLTGAALVNGTVGEMGDITRTVLVGFFWTLSIFALTRATSFLHEVTHHQGAMPKFALAWDVLVGVPLFVPSFVYVGVHNTHHHRRAFGTSRDPEYMQHSGLGFAELVRTAAQFAVGPVVLVFRWLVLAPLSFLVPRIRPYVVTRFSSLAANPDYRRPAPVGAERRRWLALETASFVWSALAVTMVGWGLMSAALHLATLAFMASVAVVVNVLHGMRSLVSHRFHGAGVARSLEEMFDDSVNVTGHPILSELWAPIGLRYHALHHLAPRLPYHSLGAAHRLLLETLGPDDVYRTVTFEGLAELLAAHRRGRDAVGSPPSTRYPA